MTKKQAIAKITELIAEYNEIGGGQIESNNNRVEVGYAWYGWNGNAGYEGFGCWINIEGTYGERSAFSGKSWADVVTEVEEWVLDAKLQSVR